MPVHARTFQDESRQHSAMRLMQNSDLLNRLSDKFDLVRDPTLASLVRPSDREEPVQRWFHYREGYTVDIGRRYIRPEDELVVDPFCGFGSTLLAAKQAGVSAAGFDVNPLATFVSRVKTTDYGPQDIAGAESLRQRLAGLTRSAPKAASPNLRILPKLFHPEILAALNVFKASISEFPAGPARALAELCWLGILEDVSNVFREGNGVKYRNRIRRGNAYTEIPYEVWSESYFPKDKFEYVRAALLNAFDLALSDVKAAAGSGRISVHEQDSTGMASFVKPASATAAIFSPPYCNCFNYIKAYKLELWMGGFIRSYDDISKLTKRGIRSRVESLTTHIPSSSIAEVDAIASLVAAGELWSEALPNVVRGYFMDMEKVLRSIHDALTPEGRVSIVVGNSALAGVLIPTDLLLALIAERTGFRVNRIVEARHLTTSSQQKVRLEPLRAFLRESVVELTK